MTAATFKYIISSSLLVICGPLCGQAWELKDSLVLEHAIQLISADRQKHLYLNDEQGNVWKYDSTGQLIATFAPQQYGQITAMEPWQALRLFLYYESTQTYTFLDRFLSGELFNKFPTAVGFARLATVSSDNQIWIIDDRNFSLVKYDFTFNQISLQSSFNQLPERINLDPYQIKEYQNRLYVGDQRSGILVFDNLGNYLKTLSMPAAATFDFTGEELYMLHNRRIYFVDLYQEELREISVPGAYSYSRVLIMDKTMVFVRDNRLYFYRYIP